MKIIWQMFIPVLYDFGIDLNWAVCFCCDIHANFYSDGKDSQRNHTAVNSPVTSESKPALT